MANSKLRDLPTAQTVVDDGRLSVDPGQRAIELGMLSRLRTRLSAAPVRQSAEHLRAIVDVLDSGELDGAIQLLGTVVAPVAQQRFDEVPEFNYVTWRRRQPHLGS